jgi:hypothetical protein
MSMVTKCIVYELYKDMWLFVGPHGNVEKIKRRNNVSEVL